jgi:hypothetical protein
MNILSVMDRACTTLNDEGLFNPGDDLCKARAAVAELINAAKNVVDAADPKHVGSVEYRLMEALDRVGGAL